MASYGWPQSALLPVVGASVLSSVPIGLLIARRFARLQRKEAYLFWIWGGVGCLAVGSDGGAGALRVDQQVELAGLGAVIGDGDDARTRSDLDGDARLAVHLVVVGELLPVGRLDKEADLGVVTRAHRVPELL